MKWSSKPVTWGGYVKFSAFVTLITAVLVGVKLVCTFWTEIKEFFEIRFKRFIHKH